MYVRVCIVCRQKHVSPQQNSTIYMTASVKFSVLHRCEYQKPSSKVLGLYVVYVQYIMHRYGEQSISLFSHTISNNHVCFQRRQNLNQNNFHCKFDPFVPDTYSLFSISIDFLPMWERICSGHGHALETYTQSLIAVHETWIFTRIICKAWANRRWWFWMWIEIINWELIGKIRYHFWSLFI